MKKIIDAILRFFGLKKKAMPTFTDTRTAATVTEFELTQPANVSLALYDGDVMIQPIQSNIPTGAGKQQVPTQGLPTGGNKIKGVKHNLQATWQGSLNTSTPGSLRHEGFDGISSFIVFTDTNGQERIVLFTNYWERNTPILQAFTSAPNYGINVLTTGRQFYSASCYQGAYYNGLVYVASYDPEGDMFVWAYNPITGLQYTFTSGQTITANAGTYSAILVGDMSRKLAVSSGYIWSLGTTALHVCTSDGGTMADVTIEVNPRSILISGSFMWVLYATYAKQYTIGEGVITPTGLQTEAIGDAMDFTLNLSTLFVTDKATQQIKKFNAITGAAVGLEGVTGGYITGPAVIDHKYNINTNSCIAFQADGKMWLNEQFNNRSLRVKTDFTFDEMILYLKAARHVVMDRTDSLHWFSDGQEFVIDYSKPFNYAAGAWALVNNWGDNTFEWFETICTYGSQRYATVKRTTNNDVRYLNLLTSTGLQDTSRTLNVRSQLYPNGIYTVDEGNALPGSNFRVFRQDITGGAQTEIINLIKQAEDPYFSGNPSELCTGEITPDGNYWAFEGSAGRQAYQSQKYHGYLISPVRDSNGHNRILVKTLPTTGREYIGDWPNNHYYDALAFDSFIASVLRSCGVLSTIWFRNEGYFQGATNRGKIFHKNGQHLFDLGTDFREVQQTGSLAGYTGNANSMHFFRITDDRYGIITGGEGINSGIMFWTIDGIQSIEEFEMPVTVENLSARIGTSNVVDLMEGVPLVPGILGVDFTPTYWTTSPIVPYNPPASDFFNVQSGIASYKTRSLSFRAMASGVRMDSGLCHIPRKATTYRNWRISIPGISFPASPSETLPHDGLPAGSRGVLQVLDSNMKVIADLDMRYASPHNALIREIAFSGVSLWRKDAPNGVYENNMNPCEIIWTGTQMKCVFANCPHIVTSVLESGANASDIKYIRPLLDQKEDNKQGHEINIDEIEFRYNE